MNRRACRALTRLHAGVRVGRRAVGGADLCVVPVDMAGDRWQAVLRHDRHAGQVSEIFEADLHLLRKIVVGYYPSAARHFGPARDFTRGRA